MDSKGALKQCPSDYTAMFRTDESRSTNDCESVGETAYQYQRRM